MNERLMRSATVVSAVAHREFQALSAEDLCRKLIKGGAFIDVKAAFDTKAIRDAGLRIWRS